LDEATSAIDATSEKLIQDALEKLRIGRTTFIIAHRIQTVMRADKILVLQHGRTVQQGNHKDLVNQAGLYREIYDIQAQIEAETTEAEQEVVNVRPIL
jgi:ABC-type multidrug transport system fused ATPase/permease subunit